MISLTHFILLISFLTVGCLTADSATCHKDDVAGLLAFKAGITADPTGLLASWKSGTDCCKWKNVYCGEDNRIISIDLYGQVGNPKSYLRGTLSPSLSKLRYLSSMNIQDLKHISGPIPSSISELPQLTYLSLGGNLLNGTIPKELEQLKKLVQLDLYENRLTGSIPEMFSAMSGLINLNISYNKLSGKIPLTISSLAPNLVRLDLSHNVLTGQIPSFFGKFHTLDTLTLSWNRLSGAVPKTFANLTKIFNLDLSHNLLVDPFPQLFVKGIESLDLSYNNFHLGAIPKWVTTSPIIYSLKLAKCGIKIRLDDWKPFQGYYSYYDYIDLSDNNITGSPVKLLNQTNYLKEFSISGNKLKFNMETLKFPNTLRNLDLSRNLVFGKLPKEISGLEKLNVSYNHLCGSIPATKFPSSAFVGNDCLCGSPLSPCKKKLSL